MKLIQNPPPPSIGPDSSSDVVVNLQDALLLLIKKGRINFPDEDRQIREEELRVDREQQVYGTGTSNVVTAFRQQLQLEPGEIVDEHTAEALNAVLKEIGAFDESSRPIERQRVVSGRVTKEEELPFAHEVVRAFHEAESGVIRLGEDTTDLEGRYTIRYEPLPEVDSINLRIKVFNIDDKPRHESNVIPGAKPLEIVDLVVETNKPPEQRRLEGQIVFDNGLPAENLPLRLYRLDFGGAATQMGEDASTHEHGQYILPFDLGGKVAGLEVRALDAEGKEIPISKPIHDIGNEPRIIVNLVAPATLRPLEAEYQRLAADLTPHIGSMQALAGAREDDERQDLTVLNRATGWDARLLALAANAEKLSEELEGELPQEAIYGLLRAGMPSNKQQLAQVNADVVKQALTKVSEAGIVSLSVEQVEETKTKFETIASATRIANLASATTFGALLEDSGLDEDARMKFASAYLNHTKGDDLWKKASDEGLDSAQIQKLQLQGKLAFLAGNSRAMTAQLMQKQITEPVQLVEKDFYQAEKWEAEIRSAAGVGLDVPIDQLSADDKVKLEVLIPVSYAGETVGDNLKAYSEDMARKVRLSYPTQVVGRMVEQDDTDTFKLGDAPARAATATLLKKAAVRGFRLGQTQIETFIQENSSVIKDIEHIETAKQNVKTLQRVYQITPNDEAMPVLTKMELTSAYDIAGLPQEAFVERYSRVHQELYPSKRPNPEHAKLVYRKAQQVSSVTLNMFTIAKKMGSEPTVYGLSAPDNVQESVRNNLIKQFPTMESLFGSLDYCDCEHCRSVLSPAAYLVDLLQFVDTEPEVWANFLVDWKKAHNNQDYPHVDKDGKPMKPYEILIQRRPDIPHISLTCENTQTALPYIDVVNEILEYYVAYEKLTENAAHDTGEATTAELLAEPQNVITEAYDKLQQARYPLDLPFDLWLETVRSFCNYFETPLWRLLETFRPSNELFAPTQPYDRKAIFIESLGLSPAEYAIFTDPDLLKDDKWYELYGFTTARPIIGAPTNADNATLTISDSEAAKFQAGDQCTYFDVSANALHAETKTIRTIGPANSGGSGQTTIEFVGVWKPDLPDQGNPGSPDAGDPLVLDAPAMLKSAKALSRRLGVSYKEIVEIIETGFVNPKLSDWGILHKLGVSIQDVIFYKAQKEFYDQNMDLLDKKREELSDVNQQRFDALKKEDENRPNEVKPFETRLREVAEFEKRLKDLTEQYPSSGLDFKDWLNNELQNNALDDILVLADPDAGCNFDLTTLRYANGNPADAIVFLKINLFVRLWRKLGWTIEEIDRALQAFMPETRKFEAANLEVRPFETALIYLAHFKQLDEQLSVGKHSRLKLITLWSDLSITGKNPLYAQLFLTRSILKSGEVFDVESKKYWSVFDDPLGNYLSPLGLNKMTERIKHEVSQYNVKPADKIDPTAFDGESRISLHYDSLEEVQYLAYQGVLDDIDKERLAALIPPLPDNRPNELTKLLDAVQVKAKDFTLIKGHQLAIQAALGLTTNEITSILEDAGMSIDVAELSLANVSLLYRYGLLAKMLKLSVNELIVLKQLSGLDPFKPLHTDPLSTLDDDFPFTQTLGFVEVVEQVEKSGLKIEDLDYLLRHRFDETGKYGLDNDATLVLMKTLADGVRAILIQHALPADPDMISEDLMRQKLGLALSPDVVERFLGMINGTIKFTENEAKLFFESHFLKKKLSLDGEAGFLEDGDFEKLFDSLKSLKPLNLLKPLKPLLKIESDEPQEQKDAKLKENEGFIKQNEEISKENEDYIKQNEEISKENEGIIKKNNETLQERRYRIGQTFLPFLQQRLIRQFIVQTMTSQLGTDPALVEALLSDTRLLSDPRSLVETFAATSERGVATTFIDENGKDLALSLFADADTRQIDQRGNALMPASANSACFEGYLEVPAAGAYRFYIVFEKMGAEATLRFDHLPRPVLTSVTAKNDDEILKGFVSLPDVN